MEEKGDMFNYLAGCCAACKAIPLVEECRSQVRVQSWMNELLNLFVCATLY